MHSIITYCSDTIQSEQFDELQKFINDQHLHSSTHPAFKNMTETSEHGLLFNIKNKCRWCYNDGEISILKFNNAIIGISAVELSLLHPHLSIGGIRCWISPDYRNKQVVTKYLLNSNLEWSRTNNIWAMMLTFNSYNKLIYDGIVRKSIGKSAGIGNIWSNWWNDCLIIDNPIDIRMTSQWCALKPINILGCKIIHFEIQKKYGKHL